MLKFQRADGLHVGFLSVIKCNQKLPTIIYTCAWKNFKKLLKKTWHLVGNVVYYK